MVEVVGVDGRVGRWVRRGDVHGAARHGVLHADCQADAVGLVWGCGRRPEFRLVRDAGLDVAGDADEDELQAGRVRVLDVCDDLVPLLLLERRRRRLARLDRLHYLLELAVFQEHGHGEEALHGLHARQRASLFLRERLLRRRHHVRVVDDVARDLARGQLVAGQADDVVLEVCAHRGEVDFDFDAGRLEDFRVADSGQLEDLRRVDRAAGDDDLAFGLDNMLLAIVDKLHTGGGGILENNPGH